jgi:protein-disulfide isomerase
MRVSQLLIGSLSVTTAALVASNIYLLAELSGLKRTLAQAHEEPLTPNDLIALVDNRLASLNKRKAKELLSSLKAQFKLAPTSTPDNHLIYGDLNARITLLEYGDIECPYCRKMHGNIKQIVEHSQGVINWKFKHFPLGMHNPVAAIESQAIECVKEAYDNRTAWIALDRFIAGTKGNGKGLGDIPKFVRSFGLNGSLIENCLASDRHKGTINQDYDDGRHIGITATPAIRIKDNNTGKEYVIKGLKTSEQLLQTIQQVLSSPQQ